MIATTSDENREFIDSRNGSVVLETLSRLKKSTKGDRILREMSHLGEFYGGNIENLPHAYFLVEQI